MSIQQAREQAKSIINEATDASKKREELIKKIATELNKSYEQAAAMVRQEEARKAAGEKYRQSEAYKQRLQQQKLVRQLLKGGN